MFKKSLQQQSNLGSSNSQALDSELPRYDVFELNNEDASVQTKLLLKFTDECTAAIRNAIKMKSKLQMRIVNGIATIEIYDSDGNLLKFKCSLQNQLATDVIFYQKGKKMYTNIGLTATVKLQVQATDKTFAEMKEKTQKLVEAEQQKKAKDMPKMQRTVKTHKHSQHMGRSATPTTTANILAKISSTNTSKRNQSPLPTSVPPVKKQKQDVEIPKSKITTTTENLKIEKKIEEEEKKEAAIQEEQLSLGSLTLPVKPSCDWKLEFGKIGNKNEATRYYECFKSEYPEYHQCYEAMEQVAGEFRKLQTELKKVNNEAERQMIEKEVRKKFTMYQADQEFLQKRQRHHDLRMKLDVIKQALYEWSKQQT